MPCKYILVLSFLLDICYLHVKNRDASSIGVLQASSHLLILLSNYRPKDVYAMEEENVSR